jgi:hypothetical protein
MPTDTDDKNKSPKDASLGELPYGWERREVLATGKVYYVNHLTHVTQWHHPAAEP